MKTNRCSTIAALLFALAALTFPQPWGEAAPELRIARAPGNAVNLELVGASPGDVWTLQDSYDSLNWRDLGAIDDDTIRETIYEGVLRRYFRAAKKSPATSQEALNKARQRWEDTGWMTYMFLYEQSGQLGLFQQLISVVDGEEVESTIINQPDFPGGIGSGKTINELFDQLQSAIDTKAHSIFARYHPTFGYPESVFIDYSKLIADEELSYAIRRPLEIPLPALEKNIALWSRRAPVAYRFHLEFFTGWWAWEGVIRVENGVAEILENGRHGAPSSDHIIQPIEGYFDLVRTAIEGEHTLSVAYDKTRGFPAFISDNWYWTFVDGPGERYWISDFQVLEVPE